MPALLFSLTLTLAPRISGNVDIHLRDATLHAKLNYDYLALDDSKSIDLLLGKSFAVSRVACAICGAFHVEAGDPSTIHIELKELLAKGARVPLTIEYSGSIAGAYHAKEEFLELGLDDFWYPVHPRIGEVEFTYALDVHIDEPRFEIVTNGKRSKRGITSRVADMDIDLVAARNLDHVRDGEIELVTKNVPLARPQQLLGDIRRVLDFYNSTFGISTPERAATGVFRPYISREGQGGYFRKGYFVLFQLDDAQAALPNIAHELAHHWWIHANQQNAWLNESFAEYSAMMAIRHVRGQAVFDAMLAEKKKRIAEMKLPPIYGFDRTKDRRSAPALFYAKGPVILNTLENAIGEKQFLELLRRAVDERVIDTDSFVALIADKPVADDFLRRLKE